MMKARSSADREKGRTVLDIKDILEVISTGFGDWFSGSQRSRQPGRKWSIPLMETEVFTGGVCVWFKM